MEIIVSEEGARTVAALKGRLDTTTSPQLEQLSQELHDKGAVDLVVDMSGCDFVSSAGLRVIVAMQKRAVVEGSLVFRSVQDGVMDVFRMTGFDTILSFE